MFKSPPETGTKSHLSCSRFVDARSTLLPISAPVLPSSRALIRRSQALLPGRFREGHCASCSSVEMPSCRSFRLAAPQSQVPSPKGHWMQMVIMGETACKTK